MLVECVTSGRYRKGAGHREFYAGLKGFINFLFSIFLSSSFMIAMAIGIFGGWCLSVFCLFISIYIYA